MSLWSAVFVPDPAQPSLLMEDGFYLFLESGDHLILE